MTDIRELAREAVERLTEIANRDSAKSVTVRADDLRTALAQLEEAREVIEPFAALANGYDGIPPPKYFGDIDCELRYSPDTRVPVTVGDLRRARAFLKGEQS